MNKGRKFTLLYLLLVGVMAFVIGILAFRVAKQNEFVASFEMIPPEAPTLWSVAEGPYAYMADETRGIFGSVFLSDAYDGIGQTQYKGLSIVCAIGVPQAPIDDSAQEVWCVIWRYDAETDMWVADNIPYLWGSVGQYLTWREAEGLD